MNEVIKLKDGLAVSVNGKTESPRLNIAGIMSTGSYRDVALEYSRLSTMIKELGCNMADPFMSISFMALLVIPEIKLRDRGLFNGKKFYLVPLFTE